MSIVVDGGGGDRKRPLHADAVRFDTLVKTKDAAMSAGFPALSLLDATPG